jgi:hypothetical protein
MKTRTAILFALFSACLLGACGVPVIGGNDNSFEITVLNNTPYVVVDQSCVNWSCSSHFNSVVLRPATSISDVEDPDGVVRPDRIVSTSGKVLGCLPFRFRSTPRTSRAVDVSEMVPCGSSGGAGPLHGRDWPSKNR